MNLALDIFGGDFAPQSTLQGAVDARKELGAEVTITLIGDKKTIESGLKDLGASSLDFAIVHTTEMVAMGEHPTRALKEKPNSSIGLGCGLLGAGKIDAFASAGNTGAMFVGGMYAVKPIEGISRPALATFVPRENDKTGIVLDVGANADCKPETLHQFAVLGSTYAKAVLHLEKPRVGLLNLGEEEEKGSVITQAAHKLLKENPRINFIGNIEGRDIFVDTADVVVCDGFTGNVALKLAESFYTFLQKRKIKDPFFDRWNYETYGGSPVLGLNAPLVIGHGISSAKAISRMLHMCHDMVQNQLTSKIRQAF